MRFTFTLMLIFILGGCGARFNSIYRTDSMDGLSVRSIDAKQRLVFSKPSEKGNTMVCPEPSPDALSAGAAGANISADQLGKLLGLGVGGASAESAGSIGLRTQTISLLRDQMTHLCLIRMADRINDKQYLEMLRRLQVSALGMLAIEQLTGATKAPPIIVQVGAQQTGAEPAGTNNEAKKAAPSITLNTSGSTVSGPDANKDNNPGSPNVSETVFNILSLVISQGFTTPACRISLARFEKAILSNDSRAIDDAYSKVMQACGDEVSETVAKLKSKDIGQKFVNLASVKDSEIFESRKEEILSAVDNLPSSSKYLEAYDIGIFACQSDSDSYKNIQQEIQSQTIGSVRITRLSDIQFQNRSKVLKISDAPLGVVFYDKNFGSERDFAEKLQASVQAKIPSLKIRAEANNEEQPRTPYYLSLWLCKGK